MTGRDFPVQLSGCEAALHLSVREGGGEEGEPIIPKCQFVVQKITDVEKQKATGHERE